MNKFIIIAALVVSTVSVLAEDCSTPVRNMPHSLDTLKAWTTWNKAHPNYHPHATPSFKRLSCAQVQTEGDTTSKSISPNSSSTFDINLPDRSLIAEAGSGGSSGGSGSPLVATDNSFNSESPFLYPGSGYGLGGGSGSGGTGNGGTGSNPGGGDGSGPSGPGTGIGEPGSPPITIGEPGGGSGNGPGGPSTPTAPTPEPSSLVLLGTGLLGITILFRKSRTKRLD